MLTAIVPARNEEGRISKLLNTLLAIEEINKIVVILNGSLDGTLEVVQSIPSEIISVLFFHEALGIDVPRAVGAAYAKNGVDNVPVPSSTYFVYLSATLLAP